MEFDMKIISSLTEKKFNTDFENKQMIINKFIEMFPKVKLETIIGINKYYNNKSKLKSGKDSSDMIVQIYF